MCNAYSSYKLVQKMLTAESALEFDLLRRGSLANMQSLLGKSTLPELLILRYFIISRISQLQVGILC